MRTIKKKVTPVPAHIDPEKAQERQDLAAFRIASRKAGAGQPDTDKPN